MSSLRYADFAGDAFMRDPGRAVEEMRRQGAVVRGKFPIVGKTWLTTTHEAAGALLKNADDFPIRLGGQVTGLQWWMPGIFRALATNMLTMDEPDHKRLRTIVDDAFARRAVMEMEPEIQAISRSIAEGLFASGNGKPVDLVQAYCRQVPLAVICELLGMPEEDRDEFSRRADNMTNIEGLGGLFGLMPSLYAIRRMVRRNIAAARREKDYPGLIGELVAAQAAGAEISDEELVAMVFLLLAAGQETTTHLLSGAFYVLLSQPERRDWLMEDESRIALAVEEFLRFVSPVQFSKPRTVARDIEFFGAKLKRGDKIMAMLVGANFDPETSACPHDFDMTRHPNRHLSFGTGIHFCLGHQLARLEAIVAIPALLKRWPQMKLAVPAGELEWRKRPGLRAVKRLPVVAN